MLRSTLEARLQQILFLLTRCLHKVCAVIDVGRLDGAGVDSVLSQYQFGIPRLVIGSNCQLLTRNAPSQYRLGPKVPETRIGLDHKTSGSWASRAGDKLDTSLK